MMAGHSQATNRGLPGVSNEAPGRLKCASTVSMGPAPQHQRMAPIPTCPLVLSGSHPAVAALFSLAARRLCARQHRCLHLGCKPPVASLRSQPQLSLLLADVWAQLPRLHKHLGCILLLGCNHQALVQFHRHKQR
mmetsp:Transcript_104914/g.271757  ORF Transcript_104914/g.271757 Transcript_104914/m.271757 type:complete len:135 (+) Transcript_104914:612-1016(+)